MIKRVTRREWSNIMDSVEVRRRWAEYFEQLLNEEDVRETNINVSGDCRMPVF